MRPSIRRPAQYGRWKVRQMVLQWLAVIAVAFGAGVLAGMVLGFESDAFLAIEIVLVTALLIGNWIVTQHLDWQIQGNHGEVHVGSVLKGLEADGWRMLHDIPVGHGNIDHLLVGPAGVLTIETKSRGGRIRVSAIDRAWLSQADAHRKAIQRIAGTQVDCMLVFSWAYLDKPVSRQRGVLVLPARLIRGHLQRRGAVMPAEQVEAVYRRLERELVGRHK